MLLCVSDTGPAQGVIVSMRFQAKTRPDKSGQLRIWDDQIKSDKFPILVVDRSNLPPTTNHVVHSLTFTVMGEGRDHIPSL